ncbi:hypothetical protein [Maribacter sp. IgM3_T14_3]|uniref:hypothetical protein n=1 Tax=Maribacter sp. IgM3_T14_3 TaxID=3415140 RepID=UPI003C6FAD68
MYRFILYFVLIIFGLSFSFGQIKIGDNPQNLDVSSLLELESSSKVLVITRVSNAEMQLLRPLRGGLVFNTDENCVFFYNGSVWSSLCSTGDSNSNEPISLTENGDGRYTFLGTNQLPVIFNGADDTVSVLEDNFDGTYTYTNELGEETLITITGGTLADNGDGAYIFTNSDGTTVTFNISTIQETTSTLEDNLNSTYTYTNELGEETLITITGGTLADNGDGAYIFTNNDGTTVTFNTSTTQETTSTLEDNLNGTYTYTNELGLETLIDTNPTIEEFTGITGSVLFAGTDGKVDENNANIYWDNTNARLGIKTNVPNSTVSVNGSLSTPIRFTGGDVGLNETDHTIFINGSGSSTLFMPPANGATGRMYIIKKNPSITLSVAGGYIDSNSLIRTDVSVNVLWLQSNGFNWEQVN